MSSNHRTRVLLAAAVLLLAGCGSFVRLAYNNADVGVRFMAHDYLDLDGVQSDLLRERIVGFHQWHRRAEMPQYAELLDGAGQRVRRGLTREDVAWAGESIRARYRTLVAKAIDDVTPLLDRLNGDNLTALERKLDESNEKFQRDYAVGGVERYKEGRRKALAKRYREWLGELTAEQEARIARYVADAPSFFEEQLAERKRRQAAVMAALRAGGAPSEMGAMLRGQLVSFEQHRSPQYRQAMGEWEGRLTELLLDIERSLTPKQRAHLLDRLTSYATEFRVLARVGRPAPAAAQAPVTELSAAAH
jgi:hypothetical protein